jgi:hypothetical protein
MITTTRFVQTVVYIYFHWLISSDIQMLILWDHKPFCQTYLARCRIWMNLLFWSCGILLAMLWWSFIMVISHDVTSRFINSKNKRKGIDHSSTPTLRIHGRSTLEFHEWSNRIGPWCSHTSNDNLRIIISHIKFIIFSWLMTMIVKEYSRI